jgi:hypothetical protein
MLDGAAGICIRLVETSGPIARGRKETETRRRKKSSSLSFVLLSGLPTK